MATRFVTITRQLVVGVSVAVAVGIVSVGTAPPAGACTCASTTDAEAIEQADAVFSGSLVDVVSSAGAVISSADPERFVFDVRDVFKGEVTSHQTVVTPRGGESCGLEIEGSDPYLVFGFDDSQLTSGAEDGELYSHLCSGTRPLADGDVPAEFVSSPPVSTENAPSSSEPREESATPAADDGGDGPWIAVALAAGAVLLVTLGAQGLKVTRWRRRGGRRSPRPRSAGSGAGSDRDRTGAGPSPRTR